MLSKRKLNDCYKKVRNTLDERYTPEFNVDLPITSVFNGLTQNSEWYSELTTRYQQLKNTTSAFHRLNHDISELSELQSKWKESGIKTDDFLQNFRKCIEKKDFINQATDLKSSLEHLQKKTDEYYEGLISISRENLESEKSDKVFNNLSQTRRLNSEIDNLVSFLQSNKVSAAINKGLIVSGEAGSGKSHLFCDIAKNNLSEDIPTLLFLGQHYTGGNPLRDIADQLDMRSHSYSNILGAIDAAGEASNTRTLILIDAINEGRYKEEWYNRLESLFTELKKYTNISIAVSCRSTYLEYMVPDSMLKRKLMLSTEDSRGMSQELLLYIYQNKVLPHRAFHLVHRNFPILYS